MTHETAEKIAAGLEAVAALLRESMAVQPDERKPLAQVATEKGIPPATLRELCRTRKVTAVRQGKGWLLRSSDVEAYLARRESRARVPLVRAS